MSIYLNPNNDNFKSIIKTPIYVDKTMMLVKRTESAMTRKKKRTNAGLRSF